LKASGKKGLWFTLVFVALAGVAGFLYWRNRESSMATTEAAAAAQASARQEPAGVSCLGHIEPQDGIVSIAVRSISGQPSLVSELKVHEGDWVKPGQVVAILDSRRQFEETVRDLNAQVGVAQSRLAIAKTGARRGDVAAQQAEIARLEASLQAARVVAARYEELYGKQAATVTERDQSRLQVETTTQMLNAARNRLTSIEEVRDVDVKLAEAELQAALANVEKAKVDIEPSIVRAPMAGRVLRIHAFPGEDAGPRGVLDLARTDRMFAIAEVVESDVHRVRVGQKATVTSEALAQPMHGQVESIGTQVTGQDVSPTDPRSFSDAKIVEVKIRLDDSDTASKLIHGKVTAVIEP
jgi:HlyD family secretion protein